MTIRFGPGIQARTHGHANAFGQQMFVQSEYAADELFAACDAQAGECTVGECEMLARFTADETAVRAKARAVVRVVPPRASPRGAKCGRRYGELIARRCLRVAQGIDAAERGGEVLALGVADRVPREVTGRLAGQRERGELLPRIVLLIRRPVAAFLLEHARGREQFHAFAQGVPPPRRQPAVATPGWNINLAASL